MHPSQRSLSFVERDIALRDFGVQAAGHEFLTAKSSGEKAAFVFTLFRLNQESSGQSSLPKNHESTWILVSESTSCGLEFACDIRRLPAQRRIQAPGSQQTLKVIDSLVACALKILVAQIHFLVSLVKFAGAFAGIPLRLEAGKSTRYPAEVNAVASLVGTSVRRVLNLAAWYGFLDDFCQIANLIVFLTPANVKCFVMHDFTRRFQGSKERSRNIFDMNDRTPRRTITLDVNPTSREGPRDQVIKNEVEP